MPDLGVLAVFAGAVAVFAVVPGPAVLYVVTRSLEHGRLAGVISALGVAAGNLVHVAAATLGLSALLASSAAAFTTVKYLGAAYLIFLGARKLLARHHAAAPQTPEHEPPSRLLLHGVVVATLNPKTALFFLAFLPQFVAPTAGPATSQIAVLGAVLVAITATSDSCYAAAGGTAGRWLRGNQRVERRLEKVSGGICVGLGVAAAFSESRPSTT